MRVEKEVRAGGFTESGISLFDRDGEHYHWKTRQYYHPLFSASSDEWFKVRMTVSTGSLGGNIVKNVRIISE